MALKLVYMSLIYSTYFLKISKSKCSSHKLFEKPNIIYTLELENLVRMKKDLTI